MTTRAPALLAAPTLLAASSVSFAVTEALIVRSLLRAPPHVAGNALFQQLWTHFLIPGSAVAVLTNGGAAAAGAVAWRRLAVGSSARALAGWGTLAALAHFAWVPPVATLLERILNHPVDSRADVRRWLRLHYARAAVSNVTALACFLAAWLA